MKAIQTPIIITSIRSRKDGSLGFSGETPEYSTEEKIAFMELQGLEVAALLQPKEAQEVVQVEKEMESKSQSQRLRSVIYLACKALGRPEDAEKVYFKEMEALINKYKDKLD